MASLNQVHGLCVPHDDSGSAIEVHISGNASRFGEFHSGFRTLKGSLGDALRRRPRPHGNEGDDNTEFWALRNITFSVKRGESVAVIGRNGSGKSTLLQILRGPLRPLKGRRRSVGECPLLAMGRGSTQTSLDERTSQCRGSCLGYQRQKYDVECLQLLPSPG